MPLLRRRLPTHLSHQERQALVCHRPRRPGQRKPALRQGPLRLRLYQQSAAPDEAAGAQGRRRQGRRRPGRSGKPVHAFPRSDLGRGDGARRGGLEKNPRPRRAARARRLRLGQGLERRGLSFPEAGAHRLWLQQCRSLHAALSRLVGRGAARRRRLGGGDRDLQRMQEFRFHHRHRRQPDRESPRRRHLLQAGGQARRQARCHGSARAGLEASRLADDAVQERHRRGHAQRHAQRHRHREALRSAIRADLCRGLCPLRREHQGLHARGNGADLRHSGRHAARSGALLRARRKRHHLLGHGRVAAHARHRQCPLSDRTVVDLRPGRPPRHRPASAARAEQRAGRLRRRPDPDVFPRLQVGGEPGADRQIRKGLGQEARPEKGQDRGRDHGRRACRRDQGHVHHGRKSRDVRPRLEPRARRARRISNISSCRTSSSPKPAPTPT